jgi:S-DNA-T family DNA segregation ATPase FtsK/SpoIIIE
MCYNFIMPAGKTRSSRQKSKVEAKPAHKKPAPKPILSLRRSQSPHRSARPPRLILTSISPERKIDLVGILLAVIGLLTALSLLSTTHGTLTGWWFETIGLLVGWGVYLVPVVLLVIGLWLVLRNIERLPVLSVERIIGILLLFLDLVVWIHVLAGGGLDLAKAHQGGGYVGGLLEMGLVSTLGLVGCVIALVALLLVSLVFAFDLSVSDIFGWAPPLLARLKSLRRPSQAASPPAAPVLPPLEGGIPGLQPGFTPFSRAQGASGSRHGKTQSQVDPGRSSQDGAPADPGATDAPVPTVLAAAPAAPWRLPLAEDILEAGLPAEENGDFDRDRSHLIEETLASFGAPAHVVEIHRGPTITQFGVEPDFVESRTGRTRVRVSKIVSLADDLALALAAQRIRIQAPVPGRAYVGIEVPNSEISRVALRDVMESEGFQKIKSPLRFALGKDVAGKPVSYDLTAMPHLLIAGTTGSGKSVCVNAILNCFLMNNTPEDLRLILVDPKRVELTGYNGIPHLLAPVVVDADRVVGALQWMMREMDNRYHKFSEAGVRNIAEYNTRLRSKGERPIPYLVVVIDELADLMMLAPDETERTITRLAQLARATGLHLIIATQRPSVDVLTGLIKANFPARIAFAVASGVDSRVILDQPGAERLLGRGDMLFQAPDAPAPVRLQGVYVSEAEIQRLVEYWRLFSLPEGVSPPEGQPVVTPPQPGPPLKQTPLWDDMAPVEEGDPLLAEAIDLVRREGRASISMLQRRLRVGYSRAARMVDTMEEKGIIGPPQNNTQVRQVLDYGPTAPPKEE